MLLIVAAFDALLDSSNSTIPPHNGPEADNSNNDVKGGWVTLSVIIPSLIVLCLIISAIVYYYIRSATTRFYNASGPMYSPVSRDDIEFAQMDNILDDSWDVADSDTEDLND